MTFFARDRRMDSPNRMLVAGERRPIEILSLKTDPRKRQNAFSLFLLIMELATTVFVAGVVVPDLLRTSIAGREALAGESLHAIKFLGITLWFSYKNILVAILGLLAGGMAAWALEREGFRMPRRFRGWPVRFTTAGCGSERMRQAS